MRPTAGRKVRKRYGFDEWQKGNYLRIDSSSIIHFDLFENAANVEKLIGTGAFTINDVRRAAGQAEIDEPGGRQSFMTKNIASIGRDIKSFKGRWKTTKMKGGK